MRIRKSYKKEYVQIEECGADKWVVYIEVTNSKIQYFSPEWQQYEKADGCKQNYLTVAQCTEANLDKLIKPQYPKQPISDSVAIVMERQGENLLDVVPFIEALIERLIVEHNTYVSKVAQIEEIFAKCEHVTPTTQGVDEDYELDTKTNKFELY